MGNLKVHDKLDIQAGGQAEVLDEFGSGGQGTVYKVSYNGKTYLEISDREMLPTLKKYSPDSIKLFLKNILTELKVEDFQRYYQCGSYLRNTYTSDAGTLMPSG